MASNLQIIGKVAPTYKGVWSASAAYERLDIVANAEKTLAYIARKAVSAGTALTDTAHWAAVLDVGDVLNTVKGAAATLDENLSDRSTDVERMTNGHLFRIVPDSEHEVTRYVETDGIISEISSIPGSGFIPCPRHLCLEFADADARCYLYFYNFTDGVYTVNWDVLSTSTSTGTKNYLNLNSVSTNMLDIPDGMYMQIAITTGSVRMYGWDSEPFGMSLSADETIRTAAGENGALNAEGSSGLTIPGTAKYVCCKESAIFAIWGCKDGVFEPIDTTRTRRFWRPPDGYDFFRMRLYFGAHAPYQTVTRVGDVSDLVAVAVDASRELPSARARKVLDACKSVSAFSWTPLEALLVRGDADYTYKAGVQYNGIPYSSQWTTAHYIGWHISPHTFINALADIDSVMYLEMADAWGRKAPYYGIVCSSFATMCDGWPYPQTNAGFVYDPMVTIGYTADPPLGSIYSNLLDHCLIPARVDYASDGVDAVSMFEGARPVCGRRTRYSNINSAIDASAFNSAHLDGYLDSYGYAAHHINAAAPLSTTPYADFSDVEVVNAGALPYKGDRCVYTSNDVNVYINIKDSAATALILTAPDGTDTSIAIEAGAGRIDIRAMLAQDGIYTVHTDTNSTAASFEFRNVEQIEYTLTDGVISFSRNDFWYASVYLRGDRVFDSSELCCMPSRSDGDYSDWSSGGHYVSSAACVFYKGEYGAYAVPVTIAASGDDTDADIESSGDSSASVAGVTFSYAGDNVALMSNAEFVSVNENTVMIK